MILPIRDTRPSRYPITASPAIRWTVRLASGCYGSSSSPTPSPRSASIPRIRPSDSPPPEPAWTRSRCPRASLRLSTPMPPWSTSRRPRSTRSSSAHAPRRFRSERCARPSRPAASFPRSITSGAAAASRLSAGDGCARPAVGRTAHPDHPCRGATRPGHHRESLVPERVDDRGPPDDHHSLRARRGDRPAAGAAARGLVVCRIAPAGRGPLVRMHPRCAPGTTPVAGLGMSDAEAVARRASSALCRDGPSSPHMRRPRLLGDECLVPGRTRPGTDPATSTIRAR